MPPISISLGLTVALALAPAIMAWWTGRSVLARADDPVLPELLFERRKRLATAATVGGVAIATLFSEDALWALPLLWLAMLLSAYPLRRALFGERLGAFEFVRYAFFSLIGQVGLWLLAAATPGLVIHLALGLAPDDHAAAFRIAAWGGILCASVVGLWQHNYSRVFLAVHRATPLRNSAPPELMARFDAVLDRAAPALRRRPEVYRYGVPGAYVMNALAIPSRAHPAVALGDTLLATLSNDELTAVFAHEVAHHEEFNGKWRRRAAWAPVLIIVLIGALPALLIEGIPAGAMTISLCVPIALVFMLGRRAARRRESETRSDLRAAALTGNVEAMVSALTKLHVYSRVPRRWPHALERGATHPSLARRIQALRSTADAIARPEAQLASPLTTVRSAASDQVVAFDRDRAYWFDGVPAGAALDLHALRDAASSYRAIAYGDLAELRVGVADGARSIDATDKEGRSWQVAIAPPDVPIVQGALDAIDVKLGRRRSAVAVAGAATIRWLTAALMILLMNAGQLGVTIVPMLLVFWRPSMPAAIVATSAIAIVRLLLAARLIGWADPVRQVALLLSLGVAVVLVVQAVKRLRTELARGNGTRLAREGRTVAGVLGGLALLLTALACELVHGRSSALVGHPVAIAALTTLVGVGAALAMVPRAPWRAGAAFSGFAGLTGSFILAGDGWIVHRTAPIAWQSRRLTAVGTARIPGGGLTLTASPGGQAFAVTQYSSQRRDLPSARYVIGRLDDTTHAVRTSTASKIVFLDDETLVTLDSAAGDSLEVRAERVAAPSGKVAVLWRERISTVENPELLLDRARGTWLVVGRGSGDWSFVVASDTLGGSTPRVTGHGSRAPTDVGETLTQPLTAFGDGGAIWSTMPNLRDDGGIGLALLLTMTATPRWELRGTDAHGERFLAEVDGFPSCAKELDASGTVCVERSMNASRVWRAATASSLTRVADLPPTLDLIHAEGSDRVTAGERFGQRVTVLDVSTRRGMRLSLPEGTAARRGTRWTADLVARGDYLLVLSSSRDGATITRYAIR